MAVVDNKFIIENGKNNISCMENDLGSIKILIEQKTEENSKNWLNFHQNQRYN